MSPTRAALLRFARVLERRGDPAGDAYLRAVVAPLPYTGDDREACLRELIEALDRRGEHDVLDSLRPEVEQSYRVGHLFAKALGRRGSLEALDAYVRAKAHHWEHCTRLNGALDSLVYRGADGLRLVRGWLELPKFADHFEGERAHFFAQSRLAQAAVWLGDEALARPVITLMEAELAKTDEIDSMCGKIDLAPLCAALGEVPRATALLREADAEWDALFDEDVDGYGRVSRNALQRAQVRVAHLEAQGRLPIDERTWDEPEPESPYVPMFSSGFGRANRRSDLDNILRAGKLDEALEFVREPKEYWHWAELLRTVADSMNDTTREQCVRLLELHRRVEAAGKESAWASASVCGALARSGHETEAFAIAAATRSTSLTDKPNAELACAEVVIAKKGTHPALRPALESVITALKAHQAKDSQSDVFTTPLAFAELLLPFA